MVICMTLCYENLLLKTTRGSALLIQSSSQAPTLSLFESA